MQYDDAARTLIVNIPNREQFVHVEHIDLCRHWGEPPHVWLSILFVSSAVDGLLAY